MVLILPERLVEPRPFQQAEEALAVAGLLRVDAPDPFVESLLARHRPDALGCAPGGELRVDGADLHAPGGRNRPCLVVGEVALAYHLGEEAQRRIRLSGYPLPQR